MCTYVMSGLDRDVIGVISVIVRSKMVWDILMNSIRAKEKMEENWMKNGNKATIQRMKH